MLVVAWLFLRADAEPTGQRNWPRPSALPGHHRQIYTHLATALPGLCFFCYTVMAVTLLTFIPQLAGPDRTWLAVALPLMGTGGAFCAGWLAQYWLSPLRLLRIAFGGVGLAGLGVWLCSIMGTGIAPAAVPLMFMAGLAGGAAYALVPYLSGDSLLHARANGAIANGQPRLHPRPAPVRRADGAAGLVGAGVAGGVFRAARGGVGELGVAVSGAA